MNNVDFSVCNPSTDQRCNRNKKKEKYKEKLERFSETIISVLLISISVADPSAYHQTEKSRLKYLKKK